MTADHSLGEPQLRCCGSPKVHPRTSGGPSGGFRGSAVRFFPLGGFREPAAGFFPRPKRIVIFLTYFNERVRFCVIRLRPRT
jgi:hypothetical protein